MEKAVLDQGNVLVRKMDQLTAAKTILDELVTRAAAAPDSNPLKTLQDVATVAQKCNEVMPDFNDNSNIRSVAGSFYDQLNTNIIALQTDLGAQLDAL